MVELLTSEVLICQIAMGGDFTGIRAAFYAGMAVARLVDKASSRAMGKPMRRIPNGNKKGRLKSVGL